MLTLNRRDVAIDGDTITAVGMVSEKGNREIAAEGHAITPGFVDLHTHFDAQAVKINKWRPLGASTLGVILLILNNLEELRRSDVPRGVPTTNRLACTNFIVH